MRSFKMSLGIAIAEIYGSLSTSYLIPASATLTPSSVFYADVFSLVLLTSIGAFLLSLSFHFYIPSIYLDIVTAGQHLYTLANFIYFGLDSDESPLYWSYKCASANGIYRDMMGDICDSLGYENVSVSNCFAHAQDRDRPVSKWAFRSSRYFKTWKQRAPWKE